MEWMEILMQVVRIVVVALVAYHVVPWLKEKGLYMVVCNMVKGAEKWNKTHPIDKKAWVMERLEARGITVNEYVEALIEAACEELDLAWAQAVAGADTAISGREEESEKSGEEAGA